MDEAKRERRDLRMNSKTIPLSILKNIIPTGAMNLELLVSVAIVGTRHDLPLHCFSSNLHVHIHHVCINSVHKLC